MDTASPARIAGLYRYPVKGLTPEQLSRAELKPGQTLKADRRYAIENGPSGFDPAQPKWLPKPHFLMLMRDEWLAGLCTQFDDASQTLSIRRNGEIAAKGDLGTQEGRPQLFGRRAQGGVHHQPRQRPRHRNHGRRDRPTPALPCQPLCRGLAGVA